MTYRQAETVIKKAKQLGITAVIMGVDDDRAVHFGQHSAYVFHKYVAAVAFLLAFEIEKEK